MGRSGTDYVSWRWPWRRSPPATARLPPSSACRRADAIFNGYGNDAQKERYLKPLARGEMLGCFCLTEPHVGSDAGAISTRAGATAMYVISGSSSSSPAARTARGGGVRGHRQGRRQEGHQRLHRAYRHAGLRGRQSRTSSASTPPTPAQIVFENCRVPASQLLGAEGMGYRIALSNLEGGRICIAAQSVGMARAAFEAAWHTRMSGCSFGKPIIEHQAVDFRLADMATQIEAARQMVLHAATLRDAELPCLKEASMAKLFASEMAERVCSDAIQIHGGYGYVAIFRWSASIATCASARSTRARATSSAW